MQIFVQLFDSTFRIFSAALDFLRSLLASTQNAKIRTEGNADHNRKADLHRRRKSPRVRADTETFHMLGPDDLKVELLPGIPNDIAWQVIAPKLSGSDINTLSLVSPSWHGAVHGRWVYDARVGSQATDTFVVVVYTKAHSHARKLRLYPLNGNSAYDLPPLPSRSFRNIHGYKCIPLDGRLYILGGAITGINPRLESFAGNKKLFMLDLAGHKKWKQCSSMQEGRHSFSAGVLDGKIYVVGGQNNGQPVYKCEVYDPKVDGWSSIADLTPLRVEGQISAIGDEVFVYGGVECRENTHHRLKSRCVAVYNPVKNEWRQLGYFNGDEDKNPWINAFHSQGKFHTMTPNGIDVYDMDRNSWSNLHQFPKEIGSDGFYTRALDDREIVCINFYTKIGRLSGPFEGVRLIQSRGLGNKNIRIAFEAMGNSSLRFDLYRWSPNWKYKFCLIQL